ncbi:hypothetical protein, partial [Lentzea indica]|uniref:hypothetical protein n=1 Tax=Lentzea indica TaxID=2604800 RepID=UPI00143ABB7F
MRSVGLPLEAVAGTSFAERAALIEAITAITAVTTVTAIRSAVATVVHPHVARAAVVVEAVGRDRSHDAAAEDKAQQSHGDQLSGSVAGDTPHPAGAGRCRGG